MLVASYCFEVSYSDKHHRPVVAMVMHHKLSHSSVLSLSQGFQVAVKNRRSLYNHHQLAVLQPLLQMCMELKQHDPMS